MLTLLDNLFPWFGDMVELGGDILLLILLLAAFMWALILERLYYLYLLAPSKIPLMQSLWDRRQEHTSWYAAQFRQLLISRVSRDLHRNLELIRTLVKLCPLLGLLGTVLGMLEIFDVLAVTGNSNARATAGGVSKATVSTMAGMVIAISGLMVSNYLIAKADSIKLVLQESLEMEEPPSNQEVSHA